MEPGFLGKLFQGVKELFNVLMDPGFLRIFFRKYKSYQSGFFNFFRDKKNHQI